jgi:alpha-amylase
MFDIAINGMGLVGGDSFTFQNIDYSHFNPFNKPEYYHPYCPIDFANDTSCEVV